MSITLAPRTYFLLDRLSKLLALVMIVAGLGGVAGGLSPVLVVVGVVVGVSTIFVETEETGASSGD